MPRAKRERRERTDNWEQSQQWCRFPKLRLYESIREVDPLWNDPRRTSTRNRDALASTATQPADVTGESATPYCLFHCA